MEQNFSGTFLWFAGEFDKKQLSRGSTSKSVVGLLRTNRRRIDRIMTHMVKAKRFRDIFVLYVTKIFFNFVCDCD